MSRRIAHEFATYMDNTRTWGESFLNSKIVNQRITSLLGYLGQYNADRKRWIESQTPGPWVGAYTFVEEGVSLSGFFS